MAFSLPLRRPAALRWHLVLLVLGALLPVLVFSGIVFRQFVKAEQRVAERRLVQAAKQLAAGVDREISGSIQALLTLTQSERLETGDLAGFHREAGRVVQIQPSWMEVLLFDAAGRKLMSSGVPLGTPLQGATEPSSLRRILQTRRPTVGNLAYDDEGLLAFPVRVPVFSKGRLRYVLTAVVKPAAVNAVVGQPFTSGEEWTRTVVDAQGRVAARSRDPERFVGKLGTPSYVRRLREDREGFASETTLDGEPVYVGFARAPLSDWSASIAVPRKLAEGPARNSMLLVAGIGLALLTLSGVGAFLFSRPLSRNIDAAALAADTLAEGGRPAMASSTVAELARLSQALERSGDLLGQRERELQEHLVKAETARAEAETVSRAKDEFLAMLGHELRNPLGPIRNGVHLLGELLPPEGQVERLRGMIERQVTHLTRMVDDLLETSRITRGKIHLETRILDLRDVAREVFEGFRLPFEKSRIAFALALPPGAVWVDGDATRLAQCVGNLLSNALKFTPAGGHVRVALGLQEERASLEVRDDGCGLDPSLLPTLFQPFAQGPQAIDRSQGGLGLGLALVKGLMELHGGEVQAFSAGPGQGTRFTLLLPLASPDLTPMEPLKPVVGDYRHRILIVEDMRDAAESLEMLLSLDGHDVRIALNGREALAIALEHRPDLVICDIGLPDLDGYTLCRQLRTVPALHGATFIALTGYGQADDVQRAYEAGFTLHLTKPVEPARLRQVIAGSTVREPA